MTVMVSSFSLKLLIICPNGSIQILQRTGSVSCIASLYLCNVKYQLLQTGSALSLTELVTIGGQVWYQISDLQSFQVSKYGSKLIEHGYRQEPPMHLMH